MRIRGVEVDHATIQRWVFKFMTEIEIQKRKRKKVVGKRWRIQQNLVLACPVSWYIMHKWLDNFAYKTSISPWIFISSGMIVAIIAITIVSWQSWRSANKNPAETIRSE